MSSLLDCLLNKLYNYDYDTLTKGSSYVPGRAVLALLLLASIFRLIQTQIAPVSNPIGIEDLLDLLLPLEDSEA